MHALAGALSEAKGVINLSNVTTVHGPGNCNWSKEDAAPAAATPMLRLEVGPGTVGGRRLCSAAPVLERAARANLLRLYDALCSW